MVRLAALLCLLLAVPAEAETWQPVTAGILVDLQSVFRDDETGSVKVRAGGRHYRVAMTQNGPSLLQSSGPSASRPDDAIPHSRVTSGGNDIALAWLAGATDRYRHGVLGDDIEASLLRVRTVAGKVVNFTLREEFVFEDLIPRLADIDDDGRDEVLLVRSHVAAGASAVLLGLRGNRLVRLAESQAIGMANRWLNPIGAADFDGDGRAEVAVVETPHIGGQLLLFEIEGRRLREVARYAGYSTHSIGSTELEMAAVLDVDGDGVADILLPTQDHRALHAVTFANGRFKVLTKLQLFRPISTAIVAADIDRNGHADIVFGDQSGYVNLIMR